jgi:hypothetical protein
MHRRHDELGRAHLIEVKPHVFVGREERSHFVEEAIELGTGCLPLLEPMVNFAIETRKLIHL